MHACAQSYKLLEVERYLMRAFLLTVNSSARCLSGVLARTRSGQGLAWREVLSQCLWELVGGSFKHQTSKHGKPFSPLRFPTLMKLVTVWLVSRLADDREWVSRTRIG